MEKIIINVVDNLNFQVECIHHRSYAIMTRAKHRAGIPVNEAPKVAAATKKAKSKKALPGSIAGWNKTSSNIQQQQTSDSQQRLQLQQRLEHLQFRKPAGKVYAICAVSFCVFIHVSQVLMKG